MKYEEPNMEIILIYDYVRTTDTSGPLIWDETQEGEDIDDSGNLKGIN